jgi:hypothetical protein
MDYNFSVGDIVTIDLPNDWWDGYWKITIIYPSQDLGYRISNLVVLTQGTKENTIDLSDLRLVYSG